MKWSDSSRRSTNIEDIRGVPPIDLYKDIFKHIESLSISETEKIKMYITNFNAFADRSTGPTDWVIAFDAKTLPGVMSRILNYLKDKPDDFPLKQQTLFNLLYNGNLFPSDHPYRLNNNLIYNILSSKPDKVGVISMLEACKIQPDEVLKIIELPKAQQTQILVSKFLEIKTKIDNQGGEATKLDDSVLKEFVSKFVYDDLSQKIDSLRQETPEFRIQFRMTLMKLLTVKTDNPTLFAHFRAALDNELAKLSEIRNGPSIDNIPDTIDIIKSKSIFSFLPDSIREKIEDLFDSINDTHIISVGIVLLIMSPIIYFVFLRSNESKVKARYNISINELNMLYNMYFNFWKSDKIRFEIYDNDYNKYKEDMYTQYSIFYSLINQLNRNYKNILLDDIKTGFFLTEYCPIKHYQYFRLPEREIDKAIHSLFISSKLTNQNFYSLLKF